MMVMMMVMVIYSRFILLVDDFQKWIVCIMDVISSYYARGWLISWI